MGHDYVRAAMIYQHAVRGADEAITNAIDRQLEARDDDDEGTAGAQPSTAQTISAAIISKPERPAGLSYVERVTGIEPALSAWELHRSRPTAALSWAAGCS
ncbi:hypothetical protein [Nonomuraea sp. NPDC050202]|uniref:hypothetical protein n=1 Tax=Nonomuraea sp. NPDC050202 TaxID=3155035 RepID=UPI0033C783CD